MTGTPSSGDPTFNTAPESGRPGSVPSGAPGDGDAVVSPPRRKRWRTTLFLILLVVVVAIVLWTWAALTFSYANSEKRGYVQSIARRGWLCKTWEGELAVTPMPGTGVEGGVFAFTVRNDSVAAALQNATGELVTLQYEEHRGVPTSCFGETESYVTGFRRVP